MAESPVRKAITILRRLAECSAPVGVQQLAGDTGLNVSTVHRLLQLMAQDGMVAYDARTRVYSIGIEGIRFATQVLGADSLIGRARPIIAELAAHLGETCAFTLYEPHSFTKVIAIVERGPHPLGYDFAVGTRDGVHAGASGKPIQARLRDLAQRARCGRRHGHRRARVRPERRGRRLGPGDDPLVSLAQ
jgi:DNA-binding IclR family transcriptional regulator